MTLTLANDPVSFATTAQETFFTMEADPSDCDYIVEQRGDDEYIVEVATGETLPAMPNRDLRFLALMMSIAAQRGREITLSRPTDPQSEPVPESASKGWHIP